MGKQRVEAWQLLNTSLKLAGGELVKGWANHPARLMWADSLSSLCNYGIVMCNEWISRGYKDTLLDRFYGMREQLTNKVEPVWIFDDRLARSHRSNLLRKDPVWYGKFGWAESNDLPYYWPTK